MGVEARPSPWTRDPPLTCATNLVQDEALAMQVQHYRRIDGGMGRLSRQKICGQIRNCGVDNGLVIDGSPMRQVS